MIMGMYKTWLMSCDLDVRGYAGKMSELIIEKARYCRPLLLGVLLSVLLFVCICMSCDCWFGVYSSKTQVILSR